MKKLLAILAVLLIGCAATNAEIITPIEGPTIQAAKAIEQAADIYTQAQPYNISIVIDQDTKHLMIRDNQGIETDIDHFIYLMARLKLMMQEKRAK